MNPALSQEIVTDIWKDKYRHGDEKNIEETLRRVHKAVYAKDTNKREKDRALKALLQRAIIPGGRIHAGAGTNKRVTLINCYVGPELQDSLDTDHEDPDRGQKFGIMDSLKVSAVTQQMGGGIGNDFTPLRPKGAVVGRTGSVSSGVLYFMDMWHSMCGTIKSSGSRRGAMMGTLAVWHPDILDFIIAKREKGRLTNFNVSVLVTDAFMECVERDLDWDLYFTVPRADGEHVDVYERNGKTHYVYHRMKARELFDLITENTYIYAEPGVIFIDRVNAWNNLYYCEVISCTNPCGEQPLPPNGDCNLGHINLAIMVKNPFTPEAEIDWDLLREATTVLVRFLDNVLDVSIFPTQEQQQEAMDKRRQGLGFTGLANLFQQMRVAYGTAASVGITRQVTREMAIASYRASVELAKERGPFPMFNAEFIKDANFIKKLPEDLQADILKYGLRFGVGLTLAPVGTGSLFAGNISSGLEPIFQLENDRKVLQEDNSYRHYTVRDYGWMMYKHIHGETAERPSYFNDTMQLTVEEHLAIQAAAQEWIDASISKTVNCPTEMTIEDFRDVYLKAYRMGLKGCTTYRYDERAGRGQVLSIKKKEPQEKLQMVDVLEARRYRMKWPTSSSAHYVTISDYFDEEGKRHPFEIFINSKSAEHDDWIKALTLMITAIFRRGGNIDFVPQELQQVLSATGGAWIPGKKYVGSIVAAIGDVIQDHLDWLKRVNGEVIDESKPMLEQMSPQPKGAICPSCNAPTFFKQEGCSKCMSCGHSNCG